MNRRSFLQSTAAVGAGLAFAPNILSQAVAADPDPINIALLGAGQQGQVLLTACLNIPGVRFKAVCDIWEAFNQKRASRMLKAYGHDNNAYVDYKEMLDKEKGNIDAVIVATPDFWHAEHAIACMEAGLHVYCEKEMSNELAKARQMVEAQKKTGKFLQIGHQRRSNPRYIHCRDKLLNEADVLGRIVTVNGQWNRGARDFDGWPKNSDIPAATLEKFGFKSMEQFCNWRWFIGLGGGPIVDLGSHQIDIYGWFLGANPKSVIASGGTDYYNKNTHEWYDTVMAIYEYETKEGVVRAYYQTQTTNSCQGYFETFMGDKATLLISEAAGRGAVYREQTNQDDWDKWVKLGFLSAPPEVEETATEESVALDVRETPAPPAWDIPITLDDKPYHQPHLENFFNAIRGKEKLNCPAEVGYETAVTVLKVNEAVEAMRRLEFKPDEFKV
ncbi:MAG: Gfo/Idh/MocA family oxidoreductase [Sedimentisphaerales bacterium]|nr:Gfo/Idh/MocA family oxidoreductase [Sedimentisphaerales bacterium]